MTRFAAALALFALAFGSVVAQDKKPADPPKDEKKDEKKDAKEAPKDDKKDAKELEGTYKILSAERPKDFKGEGKDEVLLKLVRKKAK